MNTTLASLGQRIAAQEDREAWYLGRIGYREALDLQIALVKAMQAGGSEPQRLLLLEHPPVYSVGRRGDPATDLLAASQPHLPPAELIETDRGGAITYHGPGQLVCYFICDLARLGQNVDEFVRSALELFNAELRELGVAAKYRDDAPGLWVNGRKLASVGFRISKGVSRHGTAINIDTDMRYFAGIHPCAMPGTQMLNVRELVADAPNVEGFAKRIAARFVNSFG